MRRFLITTALIGALAACAAASGEPADDLLGAEEEAIVEIVEPAALADADVKAAAEAAPVATYVAPPTVARATPASFRDVDCVIVERNTRGGVSLEARAPGSSRVGGLEYDFVVTKSGPSGDSDIRQGGEITETMLGAVELNMDSRDRYRARLSVSDADGLVCRTEVRS